MSNLPPGVTGREYAIAGAEWSGSREVKCEAEERPFEVERLGSQWTLLATCPFEGDVDVEIHQGTMTWECPLCLAEHEQDVSDENEPDPDDARDAVRDRMDD